MATRGHLVRWEFTMHGRWAGRAGAGVALFAMGALVARLEVAPGDLRSEFARGVVETALRGSGVFLLGVAAVILATETVGTGAPVRPPSRRRTGGDPDETRQLRAAILTALEAGPATPTELARRTELFEVVVRRTLPSLVTAGEVVEADDVYRRASAGAAPGA